MTRVAWLNANMWAELCMENRDNTLFELDCYIKSLECYRDALKNRDLEKLTALLEEGKQIKEEVDG
jgi:prephenate dehydrogenase